MFTYIELVNFKSFGKIKFDFKKNKNELKKFIAIYGENGSGKSNFVFSIELLSKLMVNFMQKDELKKIQSMLEKREQFDEIMKQVLIGKINLNVAQVSLKEYRTIGSKENTKVKYGFLINGIEGYYSIVFNDDYILEEELYYLNNKQRGILFNITKNEDKIVYKISPYVFFDKKLENYINEQIEMYWGKYTLLSILLNETKEKNIEYINNSISKNILNIIDSFMSVFILCKPSPYNRTNIISGSNIKINNLAKVRIEANNETHKKYLHIMEKIIKDFFIQAYSDIIDIYYDVNTEFERDKDIVEYSLYIEKMIAGENRIIPFDIESAGTQSVLNVLRAVIEAINGNTVVYDEIDDGIHDLLMKNILLSLQDEITGQLIVTTHNTLLLEDLNPKSAYVIYTDLYGNKEARCFDDYDIRIQSSNNQRKLYLNGIFGGIPYADEIDYTNMHMDYDDNMGE